ncbi:MAG: hypothetical protein QOI20_380 [Acidimicrobiaceae bacterium]|jgi:RNA polymerase sigma-70 factor (ECF subfamily)|nr:hypothetical protein [Acidimicrobiaceae bacterium]
MAGYALPAEAEERQVVESCLRGDDDGLDLLYRRYAPALIAFCEHRLRGAGDAEDAAHDAILKAHKALPRFREGARLWPWLATIAAHICVDIQRSRERLTEHSEDREPAGPDLDEDVSRRLRASILDSAMEDLPERFRTPLFLREYMGWSYEEIAGFSNKSVGSVRTTLMRARRALHEGVEQVARQRGQWPLPVAVGGGGWRKVQDMVRGWRESMARAGNDATGALLRAESYLAGMMPGLQAAAVAVAMAAGFGSSGAVAPASATTIASTSAPIGVSRSAVANAAARQAVLSAVSTSGHGAGAPVPGPDASRPTVRPFITVERRANDVAPGGPADGGARTGIEDTGDEIVLKEGDDERIAGKDLGSGGLRSSILTCYKGQVEPIGCAVYRALPVHPPDV